MAPAARQETDLAFVDEFSDRAIRLLEMTCCRVSRDAVALPAIQATAGCETTAADVAGELDCVAAAAQAIQFPESAVAVAAGVLGFLFRCRAHEGELSEAISSLWC